MNAQYRNLIDGHLVAIATQGLIENLKKKENEKVLMSAKSAALRLRRARLSREDRLGLVSVFETLGLNEEAEKMESRIASSNAGGGGSRRGMRSPAAASRVAELADSGKSDAASRLLSQEFRTLARSALDFDQMGNTTYEMLQFQSKLSEMGLKKELLAQLDPGESANSRQLSTWAIAVEMFSDKNEAIEVYKKLLESHPTEDEARLRLLLLQSSMGQDTFAPASTNSKTIRGFKRCFLKPPVAYRSNHTTMSSGLILSIHCQRKAKKKSPRSSLPERKRNVQNWKRCKSGNETFMIALRER